MTQFYFLLGAFGVFGMTWLCPLLSLIYRSSQRSAQPNWPPRSLEILIPAHNEENSITQTLGEVLKQAEECTRKSPNSVIQVRVGADACSDLTAEKSKQLGVSTEIFSFQSKWKTLCALVATSQSDWVGFVDAETLWPKGFLKDLWDTRWSAPLLGIAPSFGSDMFWNIERHFKLLETFSGGPVSVHGACVFYERLALQQALQLLEGTLWLNDDVVIPLTLRSLFPDRALAYYVAESYAGLDPRHSQVNERHRNSTQQDFKTLLMRRRRIMAGNIQWVTKLLPGVIKNSPITAIIAARRVFRLFWAYWILFLVLGLPHYIWLSLIVLALTLKKDTVFAAFLASLAAPWQLVRRTPVSWS